MCTEDDTEASATAPDAPGSAWQAAVAAGLDMSLVEQGLAKTPWERLQDHDEALAFVEMLEATSPSGHAPLHDKLTVAQLKAIREKRRG